MKIISKLFTAVVALTIASAASADPRHDDYRFNRGAVRPVGNVVYYGGHHGGHHGGYHNGNVWVPFAVGVLTGVVVNEVRRQPEVVYVPAPQPEVVYVQPQPRVVYVPSNPNLRCDGGQWINGNYYCPRFTN